MFKLQLVLFLFFIQATIFAFAGNKSLKDDLPLSKKSSFVTLGVQTNFVAIYNDENTSGRPGVKYLSACLQKDRVKLANQKNVEDENIYVVGATAEFPGGQDALIEYLRKNLFYPREERSIRGMVMVKFLVDEKGEVQESIIMRSISPNFDRSVLRVIWNFPKWVPASDVNGNPIKSYVALPFIFDVR